MQHFSFDYIYKINKRFKQNSARKFAPGRWAREGERGDGDGEGKGRFFRFS